VSPHVRPSFFIIGERKCGTSSLYRYILEHPQVLPGQRKEMQFFTRGAEFVAANFDTYLSRFPPSEGTAPEQLCWPELDEEGKLFEEVIEFPRLPGVRYITGEASADTFAEVPPSLLRRYLPEVKLILLLRDPVERAFSHHRMLRRFQDEGRELPGPIGDFADDMRAEISQGIADGGLLSCGIYTEKLRAWDKVWGKEELLVLFTSDLQDDDKQPEILQQVRQHLSLGPWPTQRSHRPRHNSAPAAALSPEIHAELQAYFRPHNIELRDHLERDLPWMQPA
jgi:hypothetical protein